MNIALKHVESHLCCPFDHLSALDSAICSPCLSPKSAHCGIAIEAKSSIPKYTGSRLLSSWSALQCPKAAVPHPSRPLVTRASARKRLSDGFRLKVTPKW